ncbi:hypothetical protein PMIN03_003927 [Paraphaeosphaeria minitans]
MGISKLKVKFGSKAHQNLKEEGSRGAQAMDEHANIGNDIILSPNNDIDYRKYLISMRPASQIPPTGP